MHMPKTPPPWFGTFDPLEDYKDDPKINQTNHLPRCHAITAAVHRTDAAARLKSAGDPYVGRVHCSSMRRRGSTTRPVRTSNNYWPPMQVVPLLHACSRLDPAKLRVPALVLATEFVPCSPARPPSSCTTNNFELKGRCC
jgi:hypothetical protein